MSEKQQKTASILASVVTWLAVIGAAAMAILTQATDLGLELPAAVSSILAILALLARRLPMVPLDNPRASSLAIGLLVAIASLASIGPEPGPAPVAPNIVAPDVYEAPEVTPADLDDVPPIVRGASRGAQALLSAIGLAGCNPVTPGIKVAADKVTDGYTGYVEVDPLLSDQQKAERHELACNLRRLVGISVPADCPPVGGEE